MFIDILDKGHGGNYKKRREMKNKKKRFFTGPVSTMAKLHEMHFALLPHLLCSPSVSTSEFFANLKKLLAGMKSWSPEAEHIAQGWMKCVLRNEQKWQKRVGMNQCTVLEGDYVNESSGFYLEVVIVLVISRSNWVMSVWHFTYCKSLIAIGIVTVDWWHNFASNLI